MHFRGTLSLGRIGGIPIRLHFTMALVLPYLAWAIARLEPTLARYAEVVPGMLTLSPWTMGAILSVALFTCVLLHELAHVFVGLAGGAAVDGVTLMLVGGVSEVVRFPKTGWGEAAMAVAGPVMSLFLAVLCWVGFTVAPQEDLRLGLFYLMEANLGLALFNLVPAFPMDGGRIVRALLSLRLTKVKATRIASLLGQLLSAVFAAAGIVTGNLVLVAVALVVFFGARGEYQALVATQALDGLRAEEVMQPPPTVDAAEPLSHALDRMRAQRRNVCFVLCEGRLMGVLLAEDARRAAEAEGPLPQVLDLMRREIPTIAAEGDVSEAMRALQTGRVPAVAVMRGGELVGAISFGSISRALRMRGVPT